MSFDDDIALTPVGDATFAGTGPDSWSVHIGLNGGYGAAVLLHAVQLAVGEPDKPPRALTVQYLRAFPAGPFTIATEVTRRGRNVTFAAARLDQAGKTVLRATAVLARGADGLDYDDTVRPRLAPPESVPTRIADPATAPPPFVQNYDTRLVSEVLRGGPRAEVHGWLRLHEPRPVDACVLAAMADALPPASFGRVEAPGGADDRAAGAVPPAERLRERAARRLGAGRCDDDGRGRGIPRGGLPPVGTRRPSARPVAPARQHARLTATGP